MAVGLNLFAMVGHALHMRLAVLCWQLCDTLFVAKYLLDFIPPAVAPFYRFAMGMDAMMETMNPCMNRCRMMSKVETKRTRHKPGEKKGRQKGNTTKEQLSAVGR